MKLAAIADIHGNCLALEAVLADISALGISEVVNLGDHLSGPLEARRTADLLIARGFPSIRGDQDRVLVELGAPGASRRIDHRQLEPRHLDWLASQLRIFTRYCHRSSTVPGIVARWNYADIRGVKFNLTKDVYAQFSRTG